MRITLPSHARVLVTGCSTGIGRALAEELHRRGCTVIATARNTESLANLPCAEKIALDVTNAVSVEQAIAAAGSIDVLVNNAGISVWGPVEAVDIEAAQSLFDTNLFGAMRMVQAVLPAMRARGSGLILQISSAAGRNVSPLVGWYAASKRALEAASEALRLETARFGVRVSCVSLGAVTSALGANRTNFERPDYADVIAHFRARLMAKRSTPTSAEAAAAAIADIMADGGASFRYDATEDSRRIVTERRSQSDEEYEAALLTGLP